MLTGKNGGPLMDAAAAAVVKCFHQKKLKVTIHYHFKPAYFTSARESIIFDVSLTYLPCFLCQNELNIYTHTI